MVRCVALGTTRFSEPRGPGRSALVALGTPTAQGPRLTKSRSSRGSASNLYTCPIKCDAQDKLPALVVNGDST